MHLKYLIPTIKCACISALIHHAHGILTKNSALGIAFDANGDPHVLFIPATTADVKFPSYIVFCSVFLGDGITSFADSIAGLNLGAEQSVSRMAFTILSLLPSRLYETQGADERILKLASVLSGYAVTGISTGIDGEKSVADKPAITDSTHLERN